MKRLMEKEGLTQKDIDSIDTTQVGQTTVNYSTDIYGTRLAQIGSINLTLLERVILPNRLAYSAQDQDVAK